jgi:hypothetical protein
MNVMQKCTKCKKKKLFIDKCKCDLKFCIDCLPYFIHNCMFDWKNEKNKILLKENPLIECIKVSDI